MRAIFSYVSGVFQNLEVDFWPLLKVEKVFSPSRSIVTALFIYRYITNTGNLFEMFKKYLFESFIEIWYQMKVPVSSFENFNKI